MSLCCCRGLVLGGCLDGRSDDDPSARDDDIFHGRAASQRDLRGLVHEGLLVPIKPTDDAWKRANTQPSVRHLRRPKREDAQRLTVHRRVDIHPLFHAHNDLPTLILPLLLQPHRRRPTQHRYLHAQLRINP